MFRRLARLAVCVSILGGALGVPARPAAAAITECVDGLPDGTVVPGPLNVAVGEHCSLHDVVVLGNVTVAGSLYLEGGKVAGSVLGAGGQIGVVETRVSGSVVADAPAAKFFIGPAVLVCDSKISGGMTVSGGAANNATHIGGFCAGGGKNEIVGTVSFINMSKDHVIVVENNLIGGDLVCQASPLPTLNDNTVAGTVQGCA